MKKKRKVFTKLEKAFRKIFQTGPHNIATRLIYLQLTLYARDFLSLEISLVSFIITSEKSVN